MDRKHVNDPEHFGVYGVLLCEPVGDSLTYGDLRRLSSVPLRPIYGPSYSSSPTAHHIKVLPVIFPVIALRGPMHSNDPSHDPREDPGSYTL